jgi:hypothetical protein
MNAEPHPPEDEGPDSCPAGPASGWGSAGILLAGVGALLGAAAIVSLTMSTVSAPQAIALGLPAALLVVAGLILALPKDAAGRRLGYRAGFYLGTIIGQLRSRWRHPHDR